MLPKKKPVASAEKASDSHPDEPVAGTSTGGQTAPTPTSPPPSYNSDPDWEPAEKKSSGQAGHSVGKSTKFRFVAGYQKTNGTDLRFSFWGVFNYVKTLKQVFSVTDSVLSEVTM